MEAAPGGDRSTARGRLHFRVSSVVAGNRIVGLQPAATSPATDSGTHQLGQPPTLSMARSEPG